MLRILSTLIAATLFACATGSTPPSNSAVDWAEVDERWSILVVTTDEDGRDRVTRIWTAVLDGEGVFRTNDSRWWANLQREPRLRVRHGGLDHAFDVEFVDDIEERGRIDEVFLAKYGWMERLMFPQARGETHENFGRMIR